MKIYGKGMLSLEVPGNLEHVSNEHKQDVPMEYILNKISSIWQDESKPNVLIVKAKTGSGKSVYMPKEIFKHFVCDVMVAEPTIANATKIPVDVAYLYGLKLGINLGYYTGGLMMPTTANPAITYNTTQMVINFVKSYDNKNNLVIILDEAHSSSLQTVEMLAVLKDLSKKSLTGKDPFIIITSATIDINRYATYFNTTESVEVKGSTSNKIYRFPMEEVNDVVGQLKRVIKEIFKEAKQNDDTLIFCPTMMVMRKLLPRLQDIDPKAKFITFQSSDTQLGTQNYSDVLTPANHLNCTHKVILATDVAETGITFSNLKYVIDLGYQNFVFKNPSKGITTIINTFPAPQDSAEQRAGRVGRNTDGYVYPMMPEYLYHKGLREYKVSGIYTDYYYPLYMWIIEKEKDIQQKFETIYPRSDDIEAYMREILFHTGLLDGNRITTFGNKYKNIRYIEPDDFKFIGLCQYKGIQCVQAVDMLYAQKLGLNYSNSDNIILDHVIEGYLKMSDIIMKDKVSKDDEESFIKILEERYKVLNDIQSMMINPYQGTNIYNFMQDQKQLLSHIKNIKWCLYYAYPHKIAHYDNIKKMYITLRGIEISPNIVLRSFNIKDEIMFPQYVLIHSISQVFDANLETSIKVKIISVLDGFVSIDEEMHNEYVDSNMEMLEEDIPYIVAKNRIEQYELLCQNLQHPYVMKIVTQQ